MPTLLCQPHQTNGECLSGDLLPFFGGLLYQKFRDIQSRQPELARLVGYSECPIKEDFFRSILSSEVRFQTQTVRVVGIFFQWYNLNSPRIEGWVPTQLSG